MATQQQIDDTYDYMDEIIRLSLGETPDITCAFYDGSFGKSLEDAQKDKHHYILNQIGLQPRGRVLDIGCGWGPVLGAVRIAGGHGIGLTLSMKQADSCRRNGLEAYVKDWKDCRPSELGTFDAVVSVGAFEHFCSIEEYRAGCQETIYRRFFQFCSELLPKGGRMFLQTMLWGRALPPLEALSLDAKRGSVEYMLAVLQRFYPGSWLPYGSEQILTAAEPFFSLVSMSNGRLDYLETMAQWDRHILRVSYAKLRAAIKLLPVYVRDRSFRYKMESLFTSGGYNRECLKRGVIDHERIVLQRS